LIHGPALVFIALSFVAKVSLNEKQADGPCLTSCRAQKQAKKLSPFCGAGSKNKRRKLKRVLRCWTHENYSLGAQKEQQKRIQTCVCVCIVIK
jgi:hypothetical protein